MFQIPIVLCGNKVDLPSSARQVSTEEGEAYAKSAGLPFFDTSALTPTNVDEAFLSLISSCVNSNSVESNSNDEKTASASYAEKEHVSMLIHDLITMWCDKQTQGLIMLRDFMTITDSRSCTLFHNFHLDLCYAVNKKPLITNCDCSK